MKYKSRELGKPKQFQELLGYLTAFLNDNRLLKISHGVWRQICGG